MTPKISVIMSVYNGARYLSEAIESVLTQTYKNFEFVIVNDGSIDNTSKIIQTYADNRIKVINNSQNLGLTKSLNIGIYFSAGDFIARQDADDRSLPERLEHQLAFLDSHPSIGLVGSSALWIDGQGKKIQEWHPLCGQQEIQQHLLSTIPFLHGTFMFRRECLNDVGGGYDESKPVAQDCDLLMRIAERWELDNLSEVLYIHRRHPDTVTERRREDQDYFLAKAREEAVRRRLNYGFALISLKRKKLPEWVRRAKRRWLAERFMWWSASARMFSKTTALQFLLVSLIIDPTSLSTWSYMSEILSRKLHLD